MVSGDVNPPNPCHILEKLFPSIRPAINEVAPGKSSAEKILTKV